MPDLIPASRRSTILLSLALLLLTTLVYWPGLGGGFLFDDFPNIVTNNRVHAETLDWATLKAAARGYEPGSYGRPLATVGFAFDYYLGGKNPWGYKLHSLLLHLVNALLVFWLVRRLLSLPRVRVRDNGHAAWSNAGAFVIALLWAIHPLQISSVLYIVQRMEVLSLTFVLLALLAYLRGRTQQRDGARGWPWLALSAALAGIGMLSKESAVLFPAYALALEVTVLRFEARRPRTRRFLQLAYTSGAVVALAVFAFWVLPQYMAADAYAGRDFTLYQRLLSQMRILPMYLGQMLLPLPASLTFYYDTFHKSVGWLDPATTLVGGLFLLALFAAAWRLRRNMPLAALGILWFFAAHLLTSNVISLELVFEHRNYFALLGVLLALADLVRRLPMRDGQALKVAAIGVVVLGFGLLATLRAATWGSPLLLASDLVAKNPQSARASNDLATLYIGMSGGDAQSPFYSFGAQEFERGSLLPNASPLPEQGLILMAATTGQPMQPQWWDRLIHKVKTRPIGPQEMMAVTGLMQQRYAGIELDDQRLSTAYAALLERAPSPQLHAQYGDYALTYLHDEALAERMFVAAIDDNPTDAEYAARIFAALTADGRSRQAGAVFRRAQALGLMSTAANGASAPPTIPTNSR